jgi:glycerol-3-phosphate acyltransferase PlsY
MRAVAWVAFAFAAGTIPSPYLLALAARRRDLIAEMRRQDSPGDAHFVVVTGMGRAPGITAIVLDIVKGAVPAALALNAGLSHAAVAWVGVAAVAGHSFAPFIRRAGGRGLTTAAGVSLLVVPNAMIGTGVISLGGTIAKRGGLGTSIGFGLLPVFALAFGYPAPLVWMSLAILGLIWIRRLEGIEEDRAAGVALPRAVLARLLFDLPRGGRASGGAPGTKAPGAGEARA